MKTRSKSGQLNKSKRSLVVVPEVIEDDVGPPQEEVSARSQSVLNIDNSSINALDTSTNSAQNVNEIDTTTTTTTTTANIEPTHHIKKKTSAELPKKKVTSMLRNMEDSFSQTDSNNDFANSQSNSSFPSSIGVGVYSSIVSKEQISQSERNFSFFFFSTFHIILLKSECWWF